ncbi:MULTISPECIES: META domain-containing protein [unclassified Oceanobacter]|uniref:META domain-containing protein n=1 Tax=unclassified Oceanobacter TaxID=2620260 RepID=UPI0026E48DA5|nr:MULTISPECIES: META domain-containing protein [unclassified Oceanobacter]MDO6683474.1 META domain-containing protein [Oceanobacter sp. 5_MG-2023]MDP2505202.1 META domain-containing protein [Oceanobacter sp. 3_MG-2023]MDP2548438.1 META domain-containing protein [Oceanobacter sp. 4_MG-2023]MDP2610359.1 META domain-containing protein [Oceanobacter sp. 1_MG-2023]MDP2613815.1 META domain-containing protein [Oceanobacter sp. 2_MG-2023]
MASASTSLASALEWQVEDINQGGIIDYSMITVNFGMDGQVSGSSGCNQYSGRWQQLDNGDIRFDQLISTRKACAPALMMQEQRFLAALQGASQYRWLHDTWLLLTDDEGRALLKLIPKSTKS